MKIDIPKRMRWLRPLLACLTAGCATHAPDFGGRWQEANHYARTPQEIPLRQPYVYAASPMDGTLRSMLARWTRDAGLHLQYEHGSDYTLFAGVAGIRTPDLRQASAQLSQAYAAQGIAIVVEGDRVVVRPAATAASN